MMETLQDREIRRANLLGQMRITLNDLERMVLAPERFNREQGELKLVVLRDLWMEVDKTYPKPAE